MAKTFLIIFLLTLSGYIFSYFYKKRESLENSMGDYLYYFALPITIFLKLVDFDINSIDFFVLVINSLPIVMIYLIIFTLYSASILTPSFARTLMISSTLGNVVYLGFAVLSYNYTEKIIPLAAVAVGIQNIIIFSIGVFFINMICYERGCVIIGTKKAFLSPIFISTVVGLVFNIFRIKIPDILNELFYQISKTTIPLALFSIGISIYGKNLNRTYLLKLVIISAIKIFILPFMSLILIFLFKRFDIISLVSFNLYSMPVAVAAYVVSKDFELEKDIVSGSIVFTTILYFVFYWFYMNLNSMIFI